MTTESIEDYIPLVKQIASNLTSERPIIDTEAYADGMVGLTIALKTYDPAKDANLRRYLYPKIYFYIIDQYRLNHKSRSQRRNNFQTTNEYALEALIQSEARSYQEELEELKQLIQKLPETQRNIMTLTLQGFDHRTISKSLNLCYSTIPFHKGQAFKSIRESLIGRGYVINIPTNKLRSPKALHVSK